MSTIEDNQEKWNSFFLIANILLRSSDRDPVQGLSATERLLLLFKRFWSDMSAVEAAAAGGIAPENSKQKSALHSRLINRLIRLGRLEDACFTADLVGSQDGLLVSYSSSKTRTLLAHQADTTSLSGYLYFLEALWRCVPRGFGSIEVVILFK